jgi:RNA polymerase sigma factor (sigma-70 family)
MHASNQNNPLPPVAQNKQPQRQLDRQALAADNIGFAYYKAKRFHHWLQREAGFPSEAEGRIIRRSELIGAAKEGLMRAAEQYDPSRGAKFITYAAYWIRKYLHQANEDHVAHTVGIVPLDAPLEDQSGAAPDEELTGHNALPDEKALLGWEIMEKRQTFEDLRAALAALSNRERAVILWHFGFYGRSLSQKELAKELGCGDRNIRLIVARIPEILQKLNHNWPGSKPYFGRTEMQKFKCVGRKTPNRISSDS